MFNVLKKTIKAGVVTIKYPYELDKVPEGFRGKPVFVPGKCTFCGDCVRTCPAGALRLDEGQDERILTLSYCRCIFCNRCEEVCRTGAVGLTTEYEMASKSKDDLEAVLRRRS